MPTPVYLIYLKCRIGNGEVEREDGGKGMRKKERKNLLFIGLFANVCSKNSL